jgi:predicted glycoside hydrolase/deacetylase ChbG (UPF0249 family)
MMPYSDSAPCLVVNADDYGCFACVSRGIIEAAENGVVTATGVFANMPNFEERVAWLERCGALDVGVHLNLTDGAPLTERMREALRRWSGAFPRKLAMAVVILSGTVRSDDVEAEWRAQVERCRGAGLKLSFLNSHEHLHMLPGLLPVAKRLAADYDIAHVRFPTARFGGTDSTASLVRSAVINVLGALNRRHADGVAAEFIGMEASGRLTIEYLENAMPRLRGGAVYELMCHPGRFDPREVTDPRLLGYHDWEGELRTLTSPAVREMLDRRGVRLIGFRHLGVENDRLVLRAEQAA